MFHVRRRCLASIFTAVLLSITCLAQATTTFSTGTQFPTGGHEPTGVAVGDLNGDGIPDLVVCNRGESTVAVLLGIGDGTFQAPVTYNISTEPYLQAVVVADFNNDGKLDVAVASVNYNNPLGGEVAVLLGKGDGTLTTTPITSGGDSAPIQMLAVDLNGDRKMDLVIGGNGSPTVLYGKGDGTFQAPVYLPCPGNGPACFGVAVADFNGDGRLDVAVVTNGWADGSGVYMGVDLQNPDGSFPLAWSYTLPYDWQYGYGIAAGDLNGDGKADVVLGCNGSGDGGIFFGNGDGTFQDPVRFVVFSGANNMLLQDFNNDKRLDLEVGNFEDPTMGVSVYTNPGNGVFDYERAAFLQTAGGTTEVAYGDFNVDGYLDVVSADYTANVVSVFLNTTGPATQPLTAATVGSGTIISGDGYINCGKICLRRYPTGTKLALRAMPAVGFTLSNWSGCASHNGNVCTVAVNSTTSVEATFSPVTVTFSSLAFNPSTIRSGNISVGTLALAAPVPSGGVTLRVTSSQPRIVAVPSTVYIPGGASTYRFAARAINSRPAVVTITATDGSTAVAGELNVSPNSLTEDPSKVTPTERVPASANPPVAVRRVTARTTPSSE